MDKAHTADAFFLCRATPGDIPALLGWIQKLAAHEKRPWAATADEGALRRWLFEQPVARAVLAFFEGKAAGYAIYYPAFSSFTGRCSLYLEDLYLLPELRGHGLGRLFMRHMARIGLAEGCTGMKWTCLANNGAGLRFYTALGAQRDEGSLHYSFSEEALIALAGE